MGAIAVFDYQTFIVRYPEFTNVTAPLIEAYWTEGAIWLRNDGGGPVTTIPVQAMLLNMLAAHIAWLNAPRGSDGLPADTGQPASPLVGAITDATEGSVNVSVQNDYPPGTPQWFQQTKYGSAYWSATAPYRTMRYRPPPNVGTPVNPWPYVRGGWPRGW